MYFVEEKKMLGEKKFCNFYQSIKWFTKKQKILANVTILNGNTFYIAFMPS